MRASPVLLSLLVVACQLPREEGAVAPGFRGEIAGAAIARLRSDGFACWLEHRRHVPDLDGPGPKSNATRPVLFCSKWDPSPGLECIERRYAFEVEWSDPKAHDAGIAEQLGTRPIANQSFKCVAPHGELPVETRALPPPPFDGRTAADTLALMRADRYACALEYRPRDAELDPRPRAGQSARAVVITCSRWDPSPERACIEERVVFDIEWPDPQGDPLDQLATAPVVGQAFRCVPNWNRPQPR